MRRFAFLIVMTFWSIQVFAQADYISKSDASSRAVKWFDKAEEEIRNQEYDAGIKNLERALKEHPNFIDAILLTAIAYFDQKAYGKALEYYQQGLALAPDFQGRAWYQAGVTALRLPDYGYAIEAFSTFIEIGDRRASLVDRAKKYLAQAEFAKVAVNNPVQYDLKPLGPAINTPAAEVLPALSADGELLIFTRMENRQEDFYYSLKENGEWQEAKPLEGVNSPKNEGAQCLSADGRFIVFTACNRESGIGSCDLYFSMEQNGNWTPVQNMGYPINSPAWESTPSISANGRVLFFSSDRRGGIGGRDIWYSELTADGWGTPQNMGDVINTSGGEEAPFIHPDGKTLYFMSDGHVGMGGFDLFMSRKQADGSWGKPENLGYPINTDRDEGALIVSLDGKTAYYASDAKAKESSEEALKGNADLYTFTMPEDKQPDPVTYLKGKVFDALSEEAISGIVEIIDLETGQTLMKLLSDEAYGFLVCLPSGTDYGLNVSQEGYLFYSDHFALSGTPDISKPFEKDIYLNPILAEETEDDTPLKQPIVLKNVFFETGSAALLDKSKAELDRLKYMLDEHPGMVIQINGHTDGIGSEEDNLTLSTDRAKSVYEYLIAEGIDANRLGFKGFGESQPIDTNETAEGRSRNRRTTFVVLKK